MKVLSKTQIILALCAASTFSHARTSTFVIDKEANDVELGIALKDYTSNPTELDTMATDWTNQLAVKSIYNGTVNLVLTGNYSDLYPAPETQTAIGMNFVLENGNAMTFTVKSGGTLGLRIKTAAADFSTSTACGELKLTGENANLVVEGTGKVYASSLQMFERDVNRMVTLKDQAYFFTGGTAQIGGSTKSNTLTKTSTLRLEGSQIEMVRVRNLQFVGTEGTTKDNAMGGKFEFIADANGISTIQNESAIVAFSGVIEIDFSGLKWDTTWGEDHKFTLVTATSGNTLLQDWVDTNSASNGNLANIIGAEGEFSADNYNLFVTISRDSLVIPEPSAYAAIFGAIAIAFAAYRRRK